MGFESTREVQTDYEGVSCQGLRLIEHLRGHDRQCEETSHGIKILHIFIAASEHSIRKGKFSSLKRERKY